MEKYSSWPIIKGHAQKQMIHAPSHLSNSNWYHICFLLHVEGNSHPSGMTNGTHIFLKLQSDRAARWLAPSPHSRESQVRSPPGAFLCGVCMFSPCVRGFSLGSPASTRRPKNTHVRLIGDSKLSLRVWLFISFVSMWPCDGLATCPGWTPPLARWLWDRLQPPRDPTDRLNWYRKWMDGWNSLITHLKQQREYQSV